MHPPARRRHERGEFGVWGGLLLVRSLLGEETLEERHRLRIRGGLLVDAHVAEDRAVLFSIRTLPVLRRPVQEGGVAVVLGAVYREAGARVAHLTHLVVQIVVQVVEHGHAAVPSHLLRLLIRPAVEVEHPIPQSCHEECVLRNGGRLVVRRGRGRLDGAEGRRGRAASVARVDVLGRGVNDRAHASTSGENASGWGDCRCGGSGSGGEGRRAEEKGGEEGGEHCRDEFGDLAPHGANRRADDAASVCERRGAVCRGIVGGCVERDYGQTAHMQRRGP
mmetsp:Transcript_13513/g.36098  ORF Transcript_13513/g.36098 Transcript_13513/m.36098 type:complete len:278 (+) Transcript_13513:316-1149(+)